MGKLLALSLFVFNLNDAFGASCSLTEPPEDQKQVAGLQSTACSVYDADLANSCAYRNYLASQRSRKTPEQQAKELQEKMASLHKGPLKDSAKLDASIVKKIKDYSKSACAGGPVKVRDPSTIDVVGTYNQKSVLRERYTEQNNPFEADKEKFLKLKAWGCEPATDGTDRLACRGNGYTQYVSKKVAKAFETNDVKAYVDLINANVDVSENSDLRSAEKDLDAIYGTKNTSDSYASDLAKMTSNAQATYQTDVIKYTDVIDGNGKKSKKSYVAHKKGELVFPEIKKAKDEALKSADSTNAKFFEAFDPTKNTGAFVYCPDPDQVRVDPKNQINPVKLHDPCDLSVGGNYVDNLVDPKKPLALDPGNDNQCIEEAKKAGYEISSIRIRTSSSSLNNTGDAAAKCCGKGFQCLSDARAESAKEKVPALLKGLGFEMPDASTITTDTKGANGDGTSGPCAYSGEMQNGKFKEQRIPGNASALEKGKTVTVTVSFKKPNTPMPKEVARKAAVSCQRLVFTCE